MLRFRSRLLTGCRAGAAALLALAAAATPGAGSLVTTARAAGSAAPIVSSRGTGRPRGRPVSGAPLYR